jgi:hypothetical protein
MLPCLASYPGRLGGVQGVEWFGQFLINYGDARFFVRVEVETRPAGQQKRCTNIRRWQTTSRKSARSVLI